MEDVATTIEYRAAARRRDHDDGDSEIPVETDDIDHFATGVCAPSASADPGNQVRSACSAPSGSSASG
ncbi:hypothetical protein HBB16_06875 [Pseudonocardia sp. MCCB 268]|nr:hypothetical protein [Pseudonocardia cytotoxica]